MSAQIAVFIDFENIAPLVFIQILAFTNLRAKPRG